MFRESLGRSEEESTGQSASSDLFPADSGGHLRGGECFVRGGLEGVTTLEPLPVSTLLIPPPLATILLRCRPKVTWTFDSWILFCVVMLQMRMIQRTALSYLSAAEHCLLSNCCRSIIGLTFVVSQAMQAGMEQEIRKGDLREKHLKTSPRSSTGWSAAIRKEFTRAEKGTE